MEAEESDVVQSSGNEFVKWFSRIDATMDSLVGEKGAKLGELFSKNFPVPNGFVVTTEAYKDFLEASKIDEKIKSLLKDIDLENKEILEDASKKIQGMIKNTEFPEELKEDIIDSYSVLGANKLEIEKGSALDILNNANEPIFVSVRNSLPFKSKRKGSREQDTYLNVKGNDELLTYIKSVFASLFSLETLKRELKEGFSLDKFAISAIVQKMIESEKSGVLESRDSLGNVSIHAIWGLGEGANVKEINPDRYTLSRELEVVDKSIGKKSFMVLRDSSGSLKKAKSSEERENAQVLNNYEIQRLGDLAEKIESHFEKPQKIEFAIDDSSIYIMQSNDYELKNISETPVENNEEIEIEEESGSQNEEANEIQDVQETKEVHFEDKKENDDMSVKRVEKVTKTKLKLLLDSPYSIEEAHSTGLKKVGLVEIEKIIKKSGKHPYNFLEFHYVNEYENLIYNGVLPIVKHFEEVWVRTSDFLSSDFLSLEGGDKFREMNPLLGLHGIRFGLKYSDILEAELRALKRISQETSLGVVLPNITSIEEMKKVREFIDKIGISVKLGVSIDNPAAMQLIKEFCSEGVNSIFVNSNYLLEHLLAIDLSNEKVKDLIDVMHPSFIYQLEYLLRVSKRNNVETGIYGSFLGRKDFLEYLVKKGVGFILTSPEDAHEVSENLYSVEEEVLKGTDSEPRKYEMEKVKDDYLNNKNSNKEAKEDPEIQKDVEMIEEEKKEYLSHENLE